MLNATFTRKISYPHVIQMSKVWRQNGFRGTVRSYAVMNYTQWSVKEKENCVSSVHACT